ncbi:MAG: hypothetical protein JKY09_03585 [Crocinitomicaceae bacterium]|nr:hypothetical protein [Crocinitomicaceae bacterium]
MLLVGYSWMDVVLMMLYVSIVLLVIVIAYKKLLGHLGKSVIQQEEFCVLNALEQSPAVGELEFYFLSEKEREYTLSILDGEMKEVVVVAEKNATPGGNIVRFDSTSLSNGEYYYCLKTINQKTLKKMTVMNG